MHTTQYNSIFKTEITYRKQSEIVSRDGCKKAFRHCTGGKIKGVSHLNGRHPSRWDQLRSGFPERRKKITLKKRIHTTDQMDTSMTNWENRDLKYNCQISGKNWACSLGRLVFRLGSEVPVFRCFFFPFFFFSWVKGLAGCERDKTASKVLLRNVTSPDGPFDPVERGFC